ncbi:Tim44 domain-containing protein [Oxalobacteraceae bacterium A2-2]
MNMKKILAGAMIALSAAALVAEVAAKPMGGGRSIGRQSQNVSRVPAAPAAAPQQAPRQAAPAPAPAVPPAVPAKKPSMWKGVLGGALLGLGMGALLSHFGLGGAMASMLGSLITIALIAGVLYLIFRLVRGKRPAQPAPAGFGGGQAKAYDNVYSMPQQGGTPEIGSRLQPAYEPGAAAPAAAPAAHTPWGVPSDFDTASFLRVAKSNFIRLQAAWDKGDVADIREFTTPEVFAELKMQITERGAQADYTDVVSIDAELLGIETSGSDYLASVRFNGRIKPAPDALAEPFQEVWNLSKPLSGNDGWRLAGIQQLA